MSFLLAWPRDPSLVLRLAARLPDNSSPHQTDTKIGSYKMRRLSAAALALASCCTAWSAPAATLAINHVNVVDATGTPPQADMTVVVKDGRIVELGRSDAVQAPAGAKA